MIKRVAFLLLLQCICYNLYSQVHSYSNLIYNNNSYDVFIIKVDTGSLKNFELISNKSKLTHRAFNDSLNRDTSIFMINAGISDSACSPLGYYVSKSIVKKNINLEDGNGNFYLKPNGVFIISDSAYICESSQLGIPINVKIGIQSGPLLLQNGSIHPQFNAKSTNKNIRCGVGTFIKDYELYVMFSISNTAISFYEFAEFFSQKFNCNNALCLESSGCVMNIPYTFKLSKNDNLSICNYLIYHTP